MSHSGPRTSASLLRYTIGVWNRLFRFEGGAWVYHGELVTPAIAADIGDGVGAANQADGEQWPGIPCPSGPDEPNPGPGPGPDPTDPGALIKAAPSQWAKNFGRSDAEYAWAVREGHWTEADRHRITQWWHDNGVKGRYDAATGRYLYFTYPGGVETTNVDATVSLPGVPVRGKADEATEAVVGVPIPRPYLP